MTITTEDQIKKVLVFVQSSVHKENCYWNYHNYLILYPLSKILGAARCQKLNWENLNFGGQK